jgi:hypothetical protein
MCGTAFSTTVNIFPFLNVIQIRRGDIYDLTFHRWREDENYETHSNQKQE